jgi:hypothetical protein
MRADATGGLSYEPLGRLRALEGSTILVSPKLIHPSRERSFDQMFHRDRCLNSDDIDSFLSQVLHCQVADP